jgi:hypothetical protein
MRFFTWLHSEDRSHLAERRREHGPSRRRATARPRLEMLEERRVLSTLTVTNNSDSLSGCLRAEIAAAQPGDTIVFDPSLNGQTIMLAQGQLEINKNLTIQAPGASLLAINGASSRVFMVDAGANVAISGLTIEDGGGLAYYNGFQGYTAYYDGYGGGILNLGTLALSGCTVTGNFIPTGIPTGDAFGVYHEGAGIFNEGTMTLNGCNVTGNSEYSTGLPTKGGGIFNDTQGNLTILSSVVTNNTATYGAGICNRGTMTLSGCNVTGNSASAGSAYYPSKGGGIYNDGTMTLSGSAVTGNTATSGGGIFNDTQGHLAILSSVVKNNTASDGPDICNLGSITISKDSTIGSKVSKK